MLAWASSPLVFQRGAAGENQLAFILDGKQALLSFDSMTLLLRGDGINWKSALQRAGETPLALTWDENTAADGSFIRAETIYLKLNAAD